MIPFQLELFKLIANSGALRAMAKVNFANALLISEIKIIHPDDQEPWVSMPSRVVEIDGARRRIPFVEILNAELKNEISRQVLNEYALRAHFAAGTQPRLQF